MKKLLKTLLLAVGLLFGGNFAWGESLIFSEDFSGPSYNVTWGGTSLGGVSPAVTDGKLTVANGSQSGDRSAYLAFGSNAYTGCCRLTFDMGMTKSGWSGKSNYFHVLSSATTARYPDTSNSALSITQYDSGEIIVAGESIGTYNGTMLTYDLYLNTVTGSAKVIVKNGETTLKTIDYKTTATGINTLNLQFNKNHGAFAIDNIKFYSLTAPDFTWPGPSITLPIGGFTIFVAPAHIGELNVVSNNTSIVNAFYEKSLIHVYGEASGVTTITAIVTNDGLTIEKSIEVIVGDVETTTVTVNYLCGGSPIAEVATIEDVTVGSTLNLSDITYCETIAGVGCRYANPTFSVDFPYTVVGDDVINITYTQQNAVASLNVYANVNSTNHLMVTYDLVDKYVGDVVTITYPEYYLENGLLYSTTANAHGDGNYIWNHTLTGSSVEITYETTTASNVVSYVEAETISGCTSSSGSNANIRCSDGTGAYFDSATDVVTLPAGKYHIYAQLWGNAGTTFTFSDGTNDILTGSTVGYLFTTDSEFTITESKTITVIGGNSSKFLDLVYIVKTGEVVTVANAGVATYSSNSDLDFTDVEGLKAYIASGFSPSEGEATMTSVKKVPAGEGLYLRGEPGSYEVPYGKSDYIYANLLVGVPTATVVDPTDGAYTNFILSKDEMGVIGFHKLDKSGTIASGKAYLQLPTSVFATARSIRMVFEDEEDVTGISATLNDKSKMINDKAVYDLQGRRVANPTRGLYIVGGKKIMVK